MKQTNISRTYQNRICHLSISQPFLGKFGPKTKIFSEDDIWYLEYFEYAEYGGYNLFFYFRPEVPFLRKFGPKVQSYLFKLRFATYSNLGTLNTMVLITFSILP